jgi:hypothetical protein
MFGRTNTGKGALLRTTALICVVLVMFAGFVQAVHSHSEKSKLASHECSVCSVAHAGVLHKAVQNPLPVFTETEAVALTVVSAKSSAAVLVHHIRPPPSV